MLLVTKLVTRHVTKHAIRSVTRLATRSVMKSATRSVMKSVTSTAKRLATRSATKLVRKSAIRTRLAISVTAQTLTARRQSNRKTTSFPVRYCSLAGAISFFFSHFE
jgi:hypothetical protein